MKKLRMKEGRKRQAGEALRLANAVYQEMRGECLDGDGVHKRALIGEAVGYLEMFCLSVGPKGKAESRKLKAEMGQRHGGKQETATKRRDSLGDAPPSTK